MFTLDLPATEAHYVPLTVMQCMGCPMPVANGSSNSAINFEFFAANGGRTIVSAAASPDLPERSPVASHSNSRQQATEVAADEIDGTYIKVMDCATFQRPLVPIFSPDRNFTAGWSHINDPNKAADFTALQQSFDAYSIHSGNLQIDGSCNGEQTYSTILVKKLHTWNNTHANGLETAFKGSPISEIGSLIVELKLNSARSVIPSLRQIRAAYPRLTRKQVRSLDKGMANIDLVFSTGDFRSNKLLTIDQGKYADKWIRISIPVENMNYYHEVDYKRTYTTYQAAKHQRYTGLIINAESQNKKTVQHLMDGRAGAVQLFKELDISIRRIGYVMK